MSKLTPTQRRAEDERELLALVANLLDDAHRRYAVGDDDPTASIQLFSGGLCADVVARLRARVLRRDPWMEKSHVARLPATLEVGFRMVEECRHREAARKAAAEEGGGS